jgi:proline iminopeptidase
MRSVTVRANDRTGLNVGVTGSGPDVLVLSGGPGCVHYLEHDEIAPRGMRAWYPEPRGVGRSEGGPHNLSQAVADIEAVRRGARGSTAGWCSAIPGALSRFLCATEAGGYAVDRPVRSRRTSGSGSSSAAG